MTSTPSRSLADERGSMLIEVLVSAVLVAVIGVALFGALNSAAQGLGQVQDARRRRRRRPGRPGADARDAGRHPQQLPRPPRPRGHGQDRLRRRLARRVDRRLQGRDRLHGQRRGRRLPEDHLDGVGEEHPAQAHRRHEHGHPGARHLHERRGQPRGVGRRRRRHGPRRRQRRRSTAPPATSSSPTPTAAPSSATSPSGATTSPPAPRATSTPTATRTPRARPRSAARRVATLSLTYDQAGQAKANFVTDPDDRPEIDSFQGSVGFSNAGVTTNNGVRYFTDASVPKAITTTPTLFPFPAAYSVFAGDCANNAAAHRGHARRSLGPARQARPHGHGPRAGAQSRDADQRRQQARDVRAGQEHDGGLHAEDLSGDGPRTPTSASTIRASPSAPTRSASTTASRRASRLRAASPSTVTLNTLTPTAKVFNVLTTASASACS